MTATDSRSAVDAITAAVIGGSLRSIADEMGYRLARMSYSSIIRESEDFGCAICDAQGRQLCEATQSTPLQSGPIGGYLAGIARRFEEVGDAWHEGDVVVHNHPYYGASHQPDVGFAVPVFVDGELVGFSVTTAHHLDLGALTPGSCGIVNAGDAFAEGLLLNAVKVEEAGRRNESAWRIIRDNCRIPHLVVGDMEAQVAAAKLGAARYAALIREHGLTTVRAAAEHQMDHAERLLRNEIAKLPDGTYAAEGFIDGFLDHPDPRYSNLRIAVAVTVSGSDLHVDLDGTAEQVDLPINMPLRRHDRHRDPRDAALAAARHRPPRRGRHQRRAVPARHDLRPARHAHQPALPRAHDRALLPGEHRRRRGHARARAGPARGRGGRRRQPQGRRVLGRDRRRRMGLHGHPRGLLRRPLRQGRPSTPSTRSTPTRATTRSRTSSRTTRCAIRRYELRDDGAGNGRWRGGRGSIREIEFLADGGFSLEGDGNSIAPPGLFGGGEGTPGSVTMNPGTPDERSLPSKLPYTRVTAGEVLRLVGPCGGGYGAPDERDPAARERDMADGFSGPAA